MFEKGILNLGALNESPEFAGSGNDTSNHVSGSNVTIPGGLKEQPTKEGIVMTTKEYEELMKQYQSSFKECGELMSVISKIKVVDEDPNVAKAVQLENAIYDAMFDIYDSGPVFEAVDRSDKKDVKKIVTSLRPKIEEFFKENDYSFRKPAIVLRIILRAIGTGAVPVVATALTAATAAAVAGPMAVAPVATAAGGLATASAAAGGISTFWGKRLWQIVGVVNIEGGNVQDVQKLLNDKFADELGEYKVLFTKTPSNLIDIISNKFGWKNKKETYFILIDKKLPAELKQLDNAVEKGLKQGASTRQNIKEGTEMNELYKEYLQSFVEYGTDGSPLTLSQFTEAVNSYNETGSTVEFVEGVASTYRKQIKQHNEKYKDDPGKRINPLSNKEIYNTVHTQRAELHAMHKAYNEARKARGEKPIGWTTFKGMKIAEIDIALSGANPLGESSVIDHLSDFLDEHAE